MASPRAVGQGRDRRANEFVPELCLRRGKEFVKAPGLERVFQPRFGAIAAVAVVDEHAHHRIRHPGGVADFSLSHQRTAAALIG